MGTEHEYHLNFDPDRLEKGAIEHFVRICKFDRDGETMKPRTRMMYERGLKALDRFRDQMSLNVLVHRLEGAEIIDGAIRIDGKCFFSSELKKLDIKEFKNIYAYLITAGELKYTEESIMDDFYIDTWGTAFVDSAHDCMLQWGRSEFSFGPGIFGMDISLLGDLLHLVNGESIGVRLTPGGMMKPTKSSGGFFLELSGDAQKPIVRCNSCGMNEKNCSFCKIGSEGCL